jgi:D-ribulokinase
LSKERGAVLLGTAILAAVAAGKYRDVKEAMKSMSKVDQVIKPNNHYQKYHDGKYKVFKKMYEYYKKIRMLSNEL